MPAEEDVIKAKSEFDGIIARLRATASPYEREGLIAAAYSLIQVYGQESLSIEKLAEAIVESYKAENALEVIKSGALYESYYNLYGKRDEELIIKEIHETLKIKKEFDAKCDEFSKSFDDIFNDDLNIARKACKDLFQKNKEPLEPFVNDSANVIKKMVDEAEELRRREKEIGTLPPLERARLDVLDKTAKEMREKLEDQVVKRIVFKAAAKDHEHLMDLSDKQAEVVRDYASAILHDKGMMQSLRAGAKSVIDYQVDPTKSTVPTISLDQMVSRTAASLPKRQEVQAQAGPISKTPAMTPTPVEIPATKLSKPVSDNIIPNVSAGSAKKPEESKAAKGDKDPAGRPKVTEKDDQALDDILAELTSSMAPSKPPKAKSFVGRINSSDSKGPEGKGR